MEIMVGETNFGEAHNMKISGRKSIAGAKPAGGSPRPANEQQVDKADRVEQATDVSISESSREVSRARESMDTLSDVRAERIQTIKPLVDDGSYKVESKVLAKRVVDEALRESARATRH